MPLPESEMKDIEAALPPPTLGDGDAQAEKAPTLPAAEALERLQRGEKLENVRVEKLVFRGAFAQPVRLQHVTLVQPKFDGATFQADVTLHGCTIDRPFFASPCEFAAGLDLTGSTLIRTQFHRLTVKGKLNCDNVHTRGRFTFTACRFEADVRFWEARFSGWAEFKKCDFVGVADFRSMHCDEGFVLQNCKFYGEFWFRGTTVSKKFEAKEVLFERLVDFSKAKLHDFCYLEQIEQGKEQLWAFTNTVGERIRVRTEQLTGRLASEQRGDNEAAMHEYAFLKRTFESLHHFDQEDWAYYRFKVCQRRSRPQSWARPWTKVLRFLDWLVLDKGCGYCTDPFRAVRTAVVLMLFFGLVYAVGIGYLPKEVDEHLPFGGERYDLLNRVVVGMYESVSVFISGLNGLSEMAKGPMTLVLIVEALSGTLLWGLFVVSFGRKVIR